MTDQSGSQKAEAHAPKKYPALHTSRFRQAEQVRNVWHVTPEEGTPFEAVLNRNYWANIAKMLRSGDRIEVMPEDMAWIAHLIVGKAAHISADVAVLDHKELKFTAPPSSAEFSIEWKGPVRKHAIISVASNTIFKDGFESRDLASAWLGTHVAKAA